MAIKKMTAFESETGQIRVLVLGLVQTGDRLLVAEGYDAIKAETFYRALGGGVEFGEASADALRREFLEELQAELEDLHYLGCLENRFTYNGIPGHEVIQVYRCQFTDPSFYQREQIFFQEGDRTHTAYWIEIDRFKTREFILYPPGFLDFVT